MDSSVRKAMPRVGALVVAGLLLALGCEGGDSSMDDAERFEFFVWANLHTSENSEVWVNGRQITGRGTVGLTTAFFDSYQHAIDVGVVLETRSEDGTVIDRCVLHAGVCEDVCEPSRESVSVCIFDDKKIWLNSWDCPCDGILADMWCSAECSVTGPQ